MLEFLRHRPAIALLLLLLQLGLVAHRIEHYVEPEHMECGEDGCAAFMPATDPPILPVVFVLPVRVAYAIRFWTARSTTVVRPPGRLGFQAHAPPI